MAGGSSSIQFSWLIDAERELEDNLVPEWRAMYFDYKVQVFFLYSLDVN